MDVLQHRDVRRNLLIPRARAGVLQSSASTARSRRRRAPLRCRFFRPLLRRLRRRRRRRLTRLLYLLLPLVDISADCCSARRCRPGAAWVYATRSDPQRCASASPIDAVIQQQNACFEPYNASMRERSVIYARDRALERAGLVTLGPVVLSAFTLNHSSALTTVNASARKT